MSKTKKRNKTKEVRILSKTEIEKRLKEIDESLATHALHISKLLQDVKTLKSDFTYLSEDVKKLKNKLRKLESKVEHGSQKTEKST